MNSNDQNKALEKKNSKIRQIELVSFKIERLIVILVGIVALLGSIGFSPSALRGESLTALLSAIAGAGLGVITAKSSKDLSEEDDD